MRLEFSLQIFEKDSNVKFHESSTNDNRNVPCGRTDRQTDVTKLTVAFRNFANAPKNTYTYYTDLFLKETIIVSRTKIVIRYFISRRL